MIKERDAKKDILAAQTLQTNMDARDALLDSLSAMAAVTTLNKAAIDRMSKSNGRILAGNPLELSEMAQALAVRQMDELVKSTAAEGLGPDTGQAAGIHRPFANQNCQSRYCMIFQQVKMYAAN